MADIVRYYISFKGRVQGVGFRWRAQTIANDLGLTGWVRNEYDGSVRHPRERPLDPHRREVHAGDPGRAARIAVSCHPLTFSGSGGKSPLNMIL